MNRKDCKVGVRIKCLEGISKLKTKNKLGTIRYTSDGTASIGIEFDENVNGHNGHDCFTCLNGYGLFVPYSRIELYEKEKTLEDIIKAEMEEKVIDKNKYEEIPKENIKQIKLESNAMVNALKTFLIQFRNDEKLFNEIKSLVNEKE